MRPAGLTRSANWRADPPVHRVEKIELVIGPAIVQAGYGLAARPTGSDDPVSFAGLVPGRAK